MSEVYLCLYPLDVLNTIQHAAILVYGHIISYNENGFSIEPEEDYSGGEPEKRIIGITSKNLTEIERYARDLYEREYDDAYHILQKNCYHFASDMSKYLCGENLANAFNRQVMTAAMIGAAAIISPVTAASYVVTQLVRIRRNVNPSSSSCIIM